MSQGRVKGRALFPLSATNIPPSTLHRETDPYHRAAENLTWWTKSPYVEYVPYGQARKEQLLHLFTTKISIWAAWTQHLCLGLLPTEFSFIFQGLPSPPPPGQGPALGFSLTAGHASSRQLLTLLCSDLPQYPGQRQLSMGRLHQTPH